MKGVPEDASTLLFNTSKTKFQMEYKNTMVHLFKDDVTKPDDQWTSHGLRRSGIIWRLLQGGDAGAVCECAGLVFQSTLVHYVGGHRTAHEEWAVHFPEEFELYVPQFESSVLHVSRLTTAESNLKTLDSPPFPISFTFSSNF